MQESKSLKSLEQSIKKDIYHESFGFNDFVRILTYIIVFVTLVAFVISFVKYTLY